MATPSNFTYGLGNPKATTITKPGQTLPTTKAPSLSAADKNDLSKALKEYNTEIARINAMTVPVAAGMTLDQVQAMLDEQAKQNKLTLDSNKAAAAALEAAKTQNQQRDSIAAITALLSSYGIGDLTTAITDAVIKGYSGDTIQLIMQDPNGTDPLAVAFQTRFPANKARLAAGKAVLSASEYLAAERSYTQVLQSYGVSSLATKSKLNAFITNDVSAAEVADRVGLAIDRVKNADPFVKAALAEFYPSLNQTDIVSAVLDPAEGLPALKRKVQIAEIGGAAAVQGLKTGLGSMSETSKQFENVTSGALGAEALASFGITQEEARKGYQTVASIAPRSEFLSSISTGEDYTRLQAEQEAFLGLASAKRARESLTAQEEGRFKEQSGLTKTTLTNKGAGQF